VICAPTGSPLSLNMISRYFPYKCNKPVLQQREAWKGGTYMPTGIVVPQRLRTTKALQQRVRREDHVFDLLDTAVLSTRHSGDVLHDSLRGLRLSSARFPRDDDALVFLICVHIVVCAFCNAENMRRNFQPVLPSILLKDLVCINAQI